MKWKRLDKHHPPEDTTLILRSENEIVMAYWTTEEDIGEYGSVLARYPIWIGVTDELSEGDTLEPFDTDKFEDGSESRWEWIEAAELLKGK